MTKLSSEEADKVLRNYPFYREFIETENQLDTNTKLDIFLKDLQGYRAELLSRGVSDNYMEEMVKLAKAVNYLHTKYGKNELINGFKQFMNALEEYNNKNSPGSFLFSFIRRTISKETEEKDLGERKRLKDDALNKENKGKIIHWLPDSKDLVDVEIVMEDNTIIKGKGEFNLTNLEEGDIVQFERFAFARLDKIEKNKMVFWYLHK